MESPKIGASRHNARTAPGNNPLSGSKPSEPPSLTGGGGSPDRKTYGSEYLVPPTPIKRRADETCYSGRPCGSLWNTHSNLLDLRRHLHYLFGISWAAISRIVGEYGVDHINQNIHETREYIRDQIAQGNEIKTLGGSFMYCMDGIRNAEPELSVAAAAERDVTVAHGLAELKQKKRKVEKEYKTPDQLREERRPTNAR